MSFSSPFAPGWKLFEFTNSQRSGPFQVCVGALESRRAWSPVSITPSVLGYSDCNWPRGAAACVSYHFGFQQLLCLEHFLFPIIAAMQ